MKGIFIHQGVEYQLNIQGESWPQEGEMSGTLEVANNSSAPYHIDQLTVELVRGDTKKIKAKKEDAFKLLESIPLTDVTVNKGDRYSLEYVFKIKPEYGLTDKKGSLYLTCKTSTQEEPIGVLELNITPLPILKKVTELIEQFLRFKVKEYSSKKDFLSTKFGTPKSKEYGTIDSMEILMRIHEKNLEMQYNFKLKKLQMVAGEMEMSKKNKKIEQTLTQHEYLMGADFPNQDIIIQKVKETLEQVKSKNIF